MEFGVLGPVEVRAGGRPVATGGGRERYVLALLLLNAGHQVPAARILDALWDEPPPSAKAQLHNMISRLRRAVGRDDLIVTRTTGYELRLSGDVLDLARFRGLVTQALRLRSAGDDAAAAGLLGEALALWRGPALADIPDELAAAARRNLDEERLSAAEARLEALLALGRYDDALAEVTPLLAAHPYREHLHHARMRALLGADRRDEALDTYELAHRTLIDGLGIEPGAALRELADRIRSGDGGPEPATRVVARQLPPLTAVLTGRDDLVHELAATLARPREAPVVAVLVGPGGVGKTTAALAAAGRVADDFTGGQLYADLRGSQETPADPHVVAGRFLHALGVRQSRLPADPEERVAMYRELLARTRTLVVLDDAAGEEQVRPLLPADPGCAALVTSRRGLAGLAGAARWTVPVLSAGAARELFTRVLGPARVAAEPAEADELARMCGQLPLAVSIVAARLAVRPEWTLAEFRDRLTRERDRLDELAVGDLDVRASIGSSFALLSEGARRLLLLLGLVVAQDWPAWVPDVLLDAPAAVPLAELVDVHLVERAGDRYRLHDLVAAFAREEPVEQDERGLLEAWLALAVEADGKVPHGEAFALPVTTGAPPVPVVEPYAWFDTERDSLLTAVAEAARLGHADLAAHLALYLSGYLELRCFYDDWLAALRTAIAAGPPDVLLVRLLCALFAAHGLADRFPEQTAVAEEELAVARRLGDRAAEITALGHAGRAARDNGRFRRAGVLLAVAVALAQQPPVQARALVDALVGKAVLHLKEGSPAEAVALLDRVRAFDDTADEDARAALHRYLYGLALVDLGRPGQAADVLAEGLAVCEAIGDDVGIVYLTWALATTDIRAGRWRAAAARLASALRGAERLGAADAMAEVLRSLGDLAAAQGRATAAIGALHRSLEIWRRLDVRVQTARTLARLERVLRAAGDAPAATACRREWQATLAELELDERCLRLPPLRT